MGARDISNLNAVFANLWQTFSLESWKFLWNLQTTIQRNQYYHDVAPKHLIYDKSKPPASIIVIIMILTNIIAISAIFKGLEGIMNWTNWIINPLAGKHLG